MFQLRWNIKFYIGQKLKENKTELEGLIRPESFKKFFL